MYYIAFWRAVLIVLFMAVCDSLSIVIDGYTHMVFAYVYTGLTLVFAGTGVGCEEIYGEL